MKHLSLLMTLLFFVTLTGKAQEVKSKKGIIYIDDKEVFTYKKNWGDVTVYKNGDEVISFEYNNNGTNQYQADDYQTIYFSEYNKKMTTIKYRAYSLTAMIERMLASKVFDTEGNFNEEGVNKFIEKYNEDFLIVK